jgi:NAD(P)H-hydrate epimerase
MHGTHSFQETIHHLDFRTSIGIHVPAVTRAQMTEIDRLAMEETGPNLFQMMENAGRNLAEFIRLKFRGTASDSRILVLAGSGGNGGGGFVAARHLANRGLPVDVLLMNPEPSHPVVAWQLHVLRSTNARLLESGMNGTVPLNSDRYALIVDALIGYDKHGAITGQAKRLIEWTRGQTAPVLSLDIPSGVEADTGHAGSLVILPTWTLTLALPKHGLHPSRTGELYLGDIGIPDGVYHRLGIPYTTPFVNNPIVRLFTDSLINTEE